MKSYDWNEINDKDIKSISKEKPIFILGSRTLSLKRIEQLKNLSLKRKVIWGLLKDKYINGLEESLQFRTQDKKSLVDALHTEKNIDVLEYYQRDLKYILNEIDFSLYIFVNGSWHTALHFKPEFWQIINKKIEYKLISPFVNEQEAIGFVENIQKEYLKDNLYDSSKKYSDDQIMKIVCEESKRSFDWNYQIAAALVKDGKILEVAHNTVVPYESYSAHFGSQREKNFAPSGDLNHYDTNHAETEILLKCLKNGLDIKGSSLYINVLPCPNCSMILSRSGIQEVVYSQDHSDGFAVKLFEKSGIKVRRFIF